MPHESFGYEKTLFSIFNLSNKESIPTMPLTLLPYFVMFEKYIRIETTAYAFGREELKLMFAS
jgi:hypothetical protein